MREKAVIYYYYDCDSVFGRAESVGPEETLEALGLFETISYH
jgi:hypothetical protein